MKSFEDADEIRKPKQDYLDDLNRLVNRGIIDTNSYRQLIKAYTDSNAKGKNLKLFKSMLDSMSTGNVLDTTDTTSIHFDTWLQVIDAMAKADKCACTSIVSKCYNLNLMTVEKYRMLVDYYLNSGRNCLYEESAPDVKSMDPVPNPGFTMPVLSLNKGLKKYMDKNSKNQIKSINVFYSYVTEQYKCTLTIANKDKNFTVDIDMPQEMIDKLNDSISEMVSKKIDEVISNL